MKARFLISLLPFFFLGCKQKEFGLHPNVEYLCKDYAEYLKESEFGSKELMLSLIEEVSKDSKYTAYRISARAPYLHEEITPNALKEIEGYLLLFFSDHKMDESDKIKIQKQLTEKGIYSEMAYKVTSNYPEWVLIVNDFDSTTHLIKDAWYKPLADLLDNIEEK